MKKKIVLAALLCCAVAGESFAAGKKGGESATETSAREFWVESMTRIVGPVFENLAQGTLRENMPVEVRDGFDPDAPNRRVTHLEALGRSFCGIAPWLNLPPDQTQEGKLRARYTDLVLRSIAQAVDPSLPDYMPFSTPTAQPLVDAAFLAHGLLRSRDRIWPMLDQITRERLVHEFKASRAIKPSESNWLCFSAMVEAALLHFTGECEMGPIRYALEKHKEWYKGDGWYGDGKEFHFDYYNSYVIQPMLTDILAVLQEKGLPEGDFYPEQQKRMVRYAVQLEKLISPEGTYPMLGRSSCYRFGAFQALSQVALMERLPAYVQPAQVRCALTSVLRRQLVPETFDKDGWLTLGFTGHQPMIADNYISTGSAYLCTFVFLPLGLPAQAPFWSDPDAEWSSVKIWAGKAIGRY